MSCVLHITGVNFDVDAFVKKSKLRPYKIFYAGQPKNNSKPNGVKSTQTGLSIDVSKADFDKIGVQIKDAIRFLIRNREKLQWISETKKIQHAVLDFGVDTKIDGEKYLIQNIVLPNKLLQLAGEAGISIELSFYAENLQDVLENRRQDRKD